MILRRPLTMENSNNNLDQHKIDVIKLRILEAETENIVAKKSTSEMVEKIQDIVTKGVDQK